MTEEAEEETGKDCEGTEIIFILVDVVPEFTDAEGWASVLRNNVDIWGTYISLCNWDVVSLYIWCAIYIDGKRVILT